MTKQKLWTHKENVSICECDKLNNKEINQFILFISLEKRKKKPLQLPKYITCHLTDIAGKWCDIHKWIF